MEAGERANQAEAEKEGLGVKAGLLTLMRPSGSHRPPNDTEPGPGTTVAEPGIFQIRSGLESCFPDRLHLPALGEGVVKFLA